MRTTLLHAGETAEILDSGLGNLTLKSYDPIKVTVTWRNKKLPDWPYYEEDVPQRIPVAYGLGKYDPGTDMFSFLTFETDSPRSPFIAGCTRAFDIPPRGETTSNQLSSYAPLVTETMVLDIFQYLAHGSMAVHPANHGHGTRWMGLSIEFFERLEFRGLRIFQNKITINP